jgi:hypothetical protein
MAKGLRGLDAVTAFRNRADGQVVLVLQAAAHSAPTRLVSIRRSTRPASNPTGSSHAKFHQQFLTVKPLTLYKTGFLYTRRTRRVQHLAKRSPRIALPVSRLGVVLDLAQRQVSRPSRNLSVARSWPSRYATVFADTPCSAARLSCSTNPLWRRRLWRRVRRQLETVGEAQVRAELRDLSLGGEERRLFIAGWLDEKEKARRRREDLFYWVSLVIGVLALGAIAAGVVVTLGSRN